MNVETAKSIVVRLYEGRRDRVGLPEVDHFHRVVTSIEGVVRGDRRPPMMESTLVCAWLHDCMEDFGPESLRDLHDEGLTQKESVVLQLLTRDEDDTYAKYIERIATAVGEPGQIARVVKLADLRDNMTRSCPPDMVGMRLPPGGRYYRAQQRLLDALMEQSL